MGLSKFLTAGSLLLSTAQASITAAKADPPHGHRRSHHQAHTASSMEGDVPEVGTRIPALSLPSISLHQRAAMNPADAAFLSQ